MTAGKLPKSKVSGHHGLAHCALIERFALADLGMPETWRQELFQTCLISTAQ